MNECPIRLELRKDGYYQLTFRTSKTEGQAAVLRPVDLAALAVLVNAAVAKDPHLEELVARLEGWTTQ